MKYNWVSDWYRQAMNNFWVPEEINLNQDKSDYPRLSLAEKTAYDKILSFLVYLDSLQSANLPKHFPSTLLQMKLTYVCLSRHSKSAFTPSLTVTC